MDFVSTFSSEKLQYLKIVFPNQIPVTHRKVITFKFLKILAGGDDRRVLLWNVQKALYDCGKPIIMRSEHHSNIFCLSFDNSVRHIYSAGNDDQVILHDIQTLVLFINLLTFVLRIRKRD